MGENKNGEEVAMVARIRHSASHVMAEAVARVFPAVKFGIGPAIDTGFYYDFDLPRPVDPAVDFPLIEKEMRRIIGGNASFSRREVTKEEAKKLFADQPYKLELIDALEDGTISIYDQGSWMDLCRGPHVESTRAIKPDSFKLMSAAGAYWKGDEKRPMLTRFYAACFEKGADLDAYLKMLEEAEKRDHRKLGRELDLFHLDDENPGQVFWHDKGWTVYRTIEDYVRRKIRANGYSEVKTPSVMPKSLWERSGH